MARRRQTTALVFPVIRPLEDDAMSPEGSFWATLPSFWATLPLGNEEPHGDWLAAYRIVEQDGQLVIAEIRILPWPRTQKERDWIDASLRVEPEARYVLDDEGNPTGPALERPAVPAGGLTARAAKAGIRTGEAIDRVREAARHHGFHEFSPEALAEPRRPGRRGHSDRFYAELAAAYVAIVEQGSRAVIRDLTKQLAEQGMHYTPEAVRDLIHDARDRGVLTRSLRGRAGGQLTDEARALLRDD